MCVCVYVCVCVLVTVNIWAIQSNILWLNGLSSALTQSKILGFV